MRIPHHRQHHQAPVTYLQPTNNNAIISANTISTSENSAISSLSSVSGYSLTSSSTTTTGTTALAQNLTISNNYSSHFRGLNSNNGNDNGNDNNTESFNTTYDDTRNLIERNDNVNLMLSSSVSSNVNYNNTLNYPQRTENQNQNQQNVNKNRQNLNLIHQKLNQNQDNLNQWKGGGGSGRSVVDEEQTDGVVYNNLNQLNNSGFKYGTKTDATRIQCLIGNNGNDEVADNNCDTKTSSMQIFEGNLNVLEEEEDTIQTQQEIIIIPESNVSKKFSNNHIESELDSTEANVQQGELEVESEPEYTDEDIEEDDDDDENLYDLDEKIQNVDNTHNTDNADQEAEEPNAKGNFQDSDDNDVVEVKVVNNSPSYQFHDNTKINIAKVESEEVETSPNDGKDDGDDIVTQKDIISFNSPNKHSNLNEANITQSESYISAAATGARNRTTENCNFSEAGPEGIAIELTRQDFTKLELEKNSREEELQQNLEETACHQVQPLQLPERHQHYGQPRSNRSGGNYQRHLDNSLSSNSAESSPDDSLMDDEDPFSDTPSSFASLDSSEPAHYPRGIINPNYPGFQHLAHTLSEHFVNHHLDQDDSDLSEFEVELSIESLDECFESYQQNNNMINGAMNNNNDDAMDVSNGDDKNAKFAMDTLQDNINDIHDNVNYNTTTDMMKTTCLTKELNLPDIQIGSTQLDTLTDINSTIMPKEKLAAFYNTDELSCDLDTYLKKFETVTDIKSLPNPSLVEDATRNCPTPDILIKNDKKSCRKKTPENRPDLLRNVSPSNSNSDCSSSPSQNGQKKLRISVPDNIALDTKTGQSSEKQEECHSYSITPVDIVGDFGREVEHEFGLIVSGYNSIGRYCGGGGGGESIDHQEISKSLEKTTDASLTDCKEEISVSTEISLSARSLIHATTATSDRTTCDLVKTSTLAITQPPNEAHTQQNSENTDDEACKQSSPESYVADDSTSSSPSIESQNSDHDHPRAAENLAQSDKLANENSNENIICNGPIDTTTTPPSPTVLAIESETSTQAAGMLQASANVINSSISSETAIAERLIPTAIVKPKYQRHSYDERQLPPIGLAYCSDQQSSSRSTTSHKSSKDPSGNVIQTSETRSRKNHNQLPLQSDRDRFVRYSKKSIGRSFQSVISRSGAARKDISSGSCVAIVTPRKKDKMENYTSFAGAMDEKEVLSSSASGRSVVFEKNNNNSGLSKCKKTNNNRKERAANAASFDVYNIETALPVIDLEAIENHLKKAKEEERKRRNDREEIRRRLAMGAEDDYFSKIVNQDRPGRKPSLQSRLQNGMNLQICFMNEASSDTESPSSDSETCPKLSKSISNSSNMSRYSSASSAHNPYHSRPLSVNIVNTTSTTTTNNNNTITTNNHQTHANNNKKFNNQMNRPSTLSLGPPVMDEDAEADFFTKQARLQIEARMALAQAKDMAHMQMEIERQKQKTSPITEVIRNSMEKVGVPFPPEKRRVSRQMLTDMNIAQLQIIVNDLHSQIERLNEQLVQYLMERDDLHMGQDSMLVDIEDLTRYLGAKEQTKLNKKSTTSSPQETLCDYTNQNQHQTPANATTQNGGVQTQNKFLRIANLVKK